MLNYVTVQLVKTKRQFFSSSWIPQGVSGPLLGGFPEDRPVPIPPPPELGATRHVMACGGGGQLTRGRLLITYSFSQAPCCPLPPKKEARGLGWGLSSGEPGASTSFFPPASFPNTVERVLEWVFRFAWTSCLAPGRQLSFPGPWFPPQEVMVLFDRVGVLGSWPEWWPEGASPRNACPEAPQGLSLAHPCPPCSPLSAPRCWLPAPRPDPMPPPLRAPPSCTPGCPRAKSRP